MAAARFAGSSLNSGAAAGQGGYNFKVVLLGEGCVGKTSCVLRYVEDKFNDKHVTTIQASFLNKKMNIRGKRVNLSIWDTAGQERFHALGPIYYRDADGAVLVYDITDPDSFAKVKNWVKELSRMLGAENICLAVVGNKTDLENQRHVDADAASEYADSVGAVHYHTSAKLNRGIEELFVDLSQRMMAKADEKAKPLGVNLGILGNNRGSITVVDDSDLDQCADRRRGSRPACCGGQ